MTCVDSEKEKEMQDLIAYADKENARKQSNAIQQQGGYNFGNSVKVPQSFNFG